MRAQAPWWLVALMACGGGDSDAGAPTGSAASPHPALTFPTALEEARDEPPDALVHHDGRAVRDAEDWRAHRRPDLLEQFRHYVYGASAAPETADGGEVERVDIDGGVRIELQGVARAHTFTVVLWVPEGQGPFPVVFGLNKCGNPSVTAEPVRDGGGWQQSDCDGPGSRASYWDVSQALASGVGVATMHQSDIHPDDPSFEGGVRDWIIDGPHEPWGAIGAWAWGLSRGVDLLAAVPEVDDRRIVAFGHSRRGKTALWAAAQDERIGAVWAHQSGTGGATLSRSYGGESVLAVTTLFPHWFAPRFATFADREPYLPIDQHQLLALAAPRPLLVTDGEDDSWADPDGAGASVDLAAEVYTFVDADTMPVQARRPGGHDVRAEDWSLAIAWLRGEGWVP